MVRHDFVDISFRFETQLNAADRIHRRNPQTVRQEMRSLGDIVPDTTVVDIEFNEMPGLQNTEQWKRIATRAIPMSNPLLFRCDAEPISVIEPPNTQKQEVPESNDQPKSTDKENIISIVGRKLFRTLRRRIVFGIAVSVILIAIIISIVVTVVVGKNSSLLVTNYYSGSVFVTADFNPILYSISSTLSKNYALEFCSLIRTTFSDTKTKYAIFYASCNIKRFRNGSIIGDFVLGFTRYQNQTRLNSFLDRTILNKQLFGGSIASIKFNTTEAMNNQSNLDYETDYEGTNVSITSETTTDVSNFSNIILSKRSILNNSNERELHITYTVNKKGSSGNLIVATNTNISYKETNQNYKCVFIPIIKHEKHSFIFSHDMFMNSSSHLKHIQSVGDNLIVFSDCNTDASNGSLTTKSLLNNALPITNDHHQHDSPTTTLLSSEQDPDIYQQSYNDNSSLSLTTVTSRSSTLDSLKEIYSNSWSTFREEKFKNAKQFSVNKKRVVSNVKTKYFSISNNYHNANYSQLPIDNRILLKEKLLQRTSSQQQKLCSNKSYCKTSTTQTTNIISSFNDQTSQLINAHKRTNRFILHDHEKDIHRHQQSLNHSNFQTMLNKKRTTISNQASNIGQRNPTVDKKHMTIKSKILNILRLFR